MKWLVFALFLLGMFASLNWYEAAASEQRLAFGLAAIAAFILVILLGTTML